ncbi:MAG: efflux transporter outer membrane subunit [Phenylobacterium sp.]|jgi:NodT family efflux transporter outer membrane factor (OMF) lipoprotein|uniref:efflux transporter outer membrane subunit n=1 Tax=Phenylobacterium sp. TaxID=1871053 RepID=UPI002A368CC0|nr:efflux transporter outer membrane subunit [Phenylobacterium sp.]MDX9999154.1 efflux transporter outer membrane subunit [Phenylobacterium sp.]
MKTRLVSTLAAAALLAGCASGPDYRAPQTPAGATGPLVSAGEPVFSPEAPPDDWWRLYQDPALDSLIAEALDNNREIAAARANLERVRAALSESRAARLPSTQLSGASQRVRQADPAGGGFYEDTVASAGVDMAYEFDLFGRISRAVEAARADAGAAEAVLDAVRLTVAAETARAYADVCAANLQIAAGERAVKLQQDTYDLTRRQLEVGRGNGLDVASAASELETTRAALPPLRAAREAAVFRLAVLTGRPPAEAPAAVRDCAGVPTLAQAIPVGDGAEMLRRRPDVREAERRLAAATARIGVATADLYPRVTLGGAFSTSDAAGRLGDEVSFSLGPLIQWSFPNVAAARARVRQASAGADAALAQFEQATLTALQETETALVRYARELDRRAALERALEAGREAARLSRMRYEAGADSLLAVLIAEQRVAQLELQLAQSQAAAADGQIVLFKALGGGWQGTQGR